MFKDLWNHLTKYGCMGSSHHAYLLAVPYPYALFMFHGPLVAVLQQEVPAICLHYMVTKFQDQPYSSDQTQKYKLLLLMSMLQGQSRDINDQSHFGLGLYIEVFRA